MSKKILLLIVCVITVQLFIVAFLAYDVSDRIKLHTSITPLSKENLLFPESENLEYFFEYAPNKLFYTMEENRPPWLDTVPQTMTNNDGMNSLHDYKTEKSPNTYRIVTLGDSWTFGIYVNTAENYSSRLEDMLNKDERCAGTNFEVLNLGVPRYDLRYSVERFNLRGKKYDPDLVIWAVIPNDFNSINEFLFPRVQKYVDELQIKSNEELFTDETGKPLPSPMYIVSSWRKAKDDQRREINESELLTYQDKALRSIRDTHKEKLLLYTWPEAMTTPPEAHTILEAFVTESPDSFYYPSPITFEKEDYLPDLHPSASGHKKTAKDMSEYLIENGLAPCSVE